MPSKSANVKNKKQYEALKDKGMSKQRAAKIANYPDSSKQGGKASGGGKKSRQGPRRHHRPKQERGTQGRKGCREEGLTVSLRPEVGTKGRSVAGKQPGTERKVEPWRSYCGSLRSFSWSVAS